MTLANGSNRNDDRMMAVTVETEPRSRRFSASVPEMLFEGAFLSEANPDSGGALQVVRT